MFQNAEFKNLASYKVLSSDFSRLIDLIALFHQITSLFWWFDDPWHQNDQYCSTFVEFIIIFFFTDFSIFYVGGCWVQLMSLFWKLIHENQISKPPEAL